MEKEVIARYIMDLQEIEKRGFVFVGNNMGLRSGGGV